MGHYVKLTYPNANMATYSANFLNAGNRYLITEINSDGKVDIVIQAKIWDENTNAELAGTINNIEISNDPNFNTSILTEDYSESYIYQCSKNSDGEISITKQSGGTQNRVTIKDWYLIGTQGEHAVYIRFNYTVDGEDFIFPRENYIHKGYSDTIVWATTPPST